MPITGLIHASLLVSDLPRALRFYQEILQLAPTARPELGYAGAWFTLPSGQQLHLIARSATASPDAEGRAGEDRHLAFAITDLEALELRLTQAGIATCRSRSGRAAVFCRDFDGNALEFVAAPAAKGAAGRA